MPHRFTEFVNSVTGLTSAEYMSIVERYQEPHRFHHGVDHLTAMLHKCRYMECDDTERCIFTLASLYHDAVYDPRPVLEGCRSSEYKSLCLFNSERSVFHYGAGIMSAVETLILASGYQESKSQASMYPAWIKNFREMDHITLSSDLTTAMKHSFAVAKEYGMHDYSAFVDAHLKAIEDITSKLPWRDDHARLLHAYKPSVGIYPGSFNPFHAGHLDILQQASTIFDHVVVAQGYNPDKCGTDLSGNIDIYPVRIDRVPLNFETVRFRGLLSSLYKRYAEKSCYRDVTIVRGFRGSSDIEYDSTQRKWVEEIHQAKIPYVFLEANHELSHVSSSALRSLMKMGVDIDKWLPDEMGRRVV